MNKAKLFFYIFCLAFLAFGTFTARAEWLQYQFSQNSSGFFPTDDSFDGASMINLTSPESGSNFQPLVGDLNGDDVNEIVAFGANSIIAYNPYLNLKTQYNAGGNILGQPTLSNVSGDKGMELILSLNVTGAHYFMAYNYSDTFTPVSSLAIGNNLSGSGIKCTSLNGIKNCIFMDNSFFIHVVNLSNPNSPVDNATQVSNSPNRANTTNYETIPAIADFDNDGNKEALFWNDNDAGDRFGFVVFDLIDKRINATPSSGSSLLYSSNQKAGHPIFAKEGSDSFTQIAFASNTGAQGQIRNYNGSGIGISPKWTRSLTSPDLAFASGTLMAIDCNNDGFEDIAGMAYGGAATRSRLFCYSGGNTELYSINPIEPTDIIERTATAVNIIGNSTPEIVTYRGIYSFDGTLAYGFSGLGTQAPIPIDANNDGKLDFLWANATNGARLFISNESSPPTFSNLNKSPEPSFKNQTVYINISWQDLAGIDTALIAHNGTENWANYTADNSFGNNIYNLTVSASNSNYSSKIIGWYSTANDTAGNRNTTGIQAFAVGNRAPTAASVSLTNSDSENRTNGTLTASWQFSDIDGDAQQGNETLWYINGIESWPLKNLTVISAENTTKGQNWSFSVMAFDGFNWSGWAYSLNTTIQNSLQYFNPALGVILAERNQLLAYDINYTDLDGDNMMFYDNSSLFSITDEGIINFTPSAIGNITVNATMSQNPGLNPNVSGVLTIEVSDTLAPVITEISKSYSGTNPVTATLSATTDENAECRFSTSDADNFTNMTRMSSTNSTSHSNAQSFNADTSGTYYAMCNDTYGNAMNSSNSTAFNADAQGTSGEDSSGEGDLGGYTWTRKCTLDWQCDSWDECKNGRQTRKCALVQLEPPAIKKDCPQDETPEQERSCKTGSGTKATCNDNTLNHGEEGVDCGGPCKACAGEKDEEEQEPKEKGKESGITAKASLITGRAIFSDLMPNFKAKHGAIFAAVIVMISGTLYYQHWRYNNVELSEEELKKLHKIMEEEYKKSRW